MSFWRSKAESSNAQQNRPAEGTYATVESLMALSLKAKGFAFLPRQPSNSILSGRHTSRLRGRGLNFEELRAYLPGDDIRTIDWKVTARTRRPYVRVYTEERDRPALLVVDQRQSMFFGSRLNMKSVTAAEAAAVSAWRIIGVGDRVGAVVFNDREIEQIRPHRSRRTVLRILDLLAEQNTELRADAILEGRQMMLNQALRSAAALVTQNHLVMVISDFDGADEQTELLLRGIASHNDVLAVMVYDPLRSKMPPPRNLVLSDGNLQVEIETGNKVVRRNVAEIADERANKILGWKASLGISVLSLSSGDETVDQIRHLLGHG